MNSFDKVCQLAGSQVKLAAILKVKPQAVFHWKRKGLVPADRVIATSAAVAYAVTPHELRADLYPHPDDGVPVEKRAQVSA
jgi:DNA-binding transcriptional regulator YdaS (Cro superfamily)